MTRLEHRDQDVADAGDGALNPEHVIEQITEIGFGGLIKPRKLQVHQLATDLEHGSEHALEADELTPQRENPGHLLAGEKGCKHALLHLEDVLLDRLDDREIAIDDEVQNGMEHIVRALAQQVRRDFEMRAKLAVRACRTLPNGDEEILAQENRGGAVGDMIAFKMCRPGDDEQLVTVDVELGNLVAVAGIFHGKRVKAVISGDVGKFCFAGLGEADPHKVILGDMLARRIDQGHRPQPFALVIKKGGDDAHGTFRCRHLRRRPEAVCLAH